jgi:adenylate kinase family enzyme
MTSDFPPLDTFGRRIMICGPSNSGKSTLAVAIGRKLGIEPIHLDTLKHLPNTDWLARDDAEFARLHDEAVLRDAWAMDGNYSRLMPSRLRRATGIIVLYDSRWANLARYFRRTLFERNRPGNLEGARDSIKWAMIRWIWISEPNAARYRTELPKAGLPYLERRGMADLERLYAAWGLTRG